MNFGKSHEILRIRCRRCRRICRRHGRARIRRRIPCCPRRESVFTLKAVGLKVITQDDEFVVDVPATDTPGDLGIQDVIFLSAKAHSLTVAAEAMQLLIGPDTVVVSAQNGVPFWYFYAHGGDLEGHTLQTVDPGARIASAIGNQRVIGCVITSSNIVEAPGVVRNIGNRVFALGEPDGTQSGCLSKLRLCLKRRAFPRQPAATSAAKSGLRCGVTFRSVQWQF